MSIKAEGRPKKCIPDICFQVILTDYDRNGKLRNRPRQILPYAIVLYGRHNMNEDEQSDLKQSVLEWKDQFELDRWRKAQHEISQNQLLHQQTAQLSMHSNLPSEMPAVPENLPSPWLGGMNGMPPPPVGLDPSHLGPIFPIQSGISVQPVMPPPRVDDCSMMPLGVDNHHMMPPMDNHNIMPPLGMDNRGMMLPPSLDNHIMPPCEISSHVGMPLPVMDNYDAHSSGVDDQDFDKRIMLSESDTHTMLPFKSDNHQIQVQEPDFDNHSSSSSRGDSRSRRSQRSRSISSVESEDVSKPKRFKDAESSSYNAELDKMVSEALSAHRRSLETRDVGVQVKTQSTIISLQKKNVSLSASTQTPDLDKEDSYEASLLRGGPLVPPTDTCVHCNYNMSDSQVSEPKIVTRMFINRRQRTRQFNSLSDRFADATDNIDDLLLGKLPYNALHRYEYLGEHLTKT